MFSSSRGQAAAASAPLSDSQIMHSEDIDAATINFDQHFTRMALNSQTSQDHSDDYSDEDSYLFEDLNENTFIGFTFDDANEDIANI